MIATVAAVVSVVVGVSLMAVPGVLSVEDPVRSVLHVIGPIAVSLGTIALWEVVRAVIRANLVVGAAAVVAAFLPAPGVPRLVAVVAGATLIATALVPLRGPDRYAGGWWGLRRT